jgi:hypothetical protein
MNKYRSAILAIALLCAMASSSSMTLGKARGAVLLGQPLKLTVPIQLDSGEVPSVLCFEAEVFYGDARLDASRVTVSSDYSQQTQSGSVHVTSSVNVDEPVVSVYLRGGCEYRTTRRFVLLADMATETAMPMDGIATGPQTGGRIAAQQASRVSEVSVPNSTTAKMRPVAEASSPPVSQASAQSLPKDNAIRRPHLKLVPIDLTQERDPTLKLTNDLYLGESENLQRRTEAAALWKSLNATPQDILSADNRRQAMDTDLKGLQVATSKNRATLQTLANRLEAAESQRYANPLVYGLFAILVLFCIGAFYAFFTGRVGGLATLPWWRTQEILKEPPLSTDHSSGDDAPGQAKRSRSDPLNTSRDVVYTPAVEKAAAALTEVDIDLLLDEPSLLTEGKTAGVERSSGHTPVLSSTSKAEGHIDFAHSMSASLRAVSTQEMLDVRQQADFFMTLGQHDEALRLLQNCVDVNLDSNPLVYLDLLRVLHTLGRKVEFDNYRTEFNALFSGHVPVYAAFNQGGHGIEAYPDICHAIESFWPSEQATGYIEKCLVRDDSDERAQGMDLEAFRDLLMLHGIAKRIESSSESALMPFMTAKAGNVEVEASYAPAPQGDFSKLEATHSVSVGDMDLGDLSGDLDLQKSQGNLIDFDPSDFSMQERSLTRKS